MLGGMKERWAARVLASACAAAMMSGAVMACPGTEEGDGSLPLFAHPIPGPISASFGVRIHPLLKVQRMHTGIDYKAAIGAPVRAAHSGKVVSAGYEGEYGVAVLIEHGDGWETFYAHLSRPSVKIGACVKAGDIIGAAGNTGFSTGPGVHFEARKRGTAIDPLRVLPHEPERGG
jgi:murein DD-endopeptidase MepM/ murein hydrolase activator NlpD